MTADNDEKQSWKDTVLSVLKGSTGSIDGGPLKVKKLRKMVLVSLQQDESDKIAKKLFKKTVQSLEEAGELSLDAGGIVSLLSGKKRKVEASKEKKKKHKKDVKDGATPQRTEKGDNDEEAEGNKNKPCKRNPQGITRLFLGNLPFAVDEASLESFLPDHVTHIKWITDKETGKFYGSAFVEMDKSVSAADAVSMAGSQLMGRKIKINFALARPGDVWPPVKKVISGGGGGGQAGGTGIKAMSAKPENCTKLFVGNCSFDIDDDTIYNFFGAVNAEVKAVRWLHHKDSGDFKGW